MSFRIIKNSFKSTFLFGEKEKGFTIIELIISLAIFSAIIFVVVDLLLNVFSKPEQSVEALDNIALARAVASDFSNEIRNAATGNDGSYSLNEAGDFQIIFYSNYKSSGNLVNRIRYYVSNNNLYKGIVTPSGNPLNYNLASEVVTIALSGLENGVMPAFYYYDGDYNGSGISLSQPINLNEVKFSKINLLVKKRQSGNDGNNFLINSGATVRNLKNNLGN